MSLDIVSPRFPMLLKMRGCPLFWGWLAFHFMYHIYLFIHTCTLKLTLCQAALNAVAHCSQGMHIALWHTDFMSFGCVLDHIDIPLLIFLENSTYTVFHNGLTNLHSHCVFPVSSPVLLILMITASSEGEAIAHGGFDLHCPDDQQCSQPC